MSRQIVPYMRFGTALAIALCSACAHHTKATPRVYERTRHADSTHSCLPAGVNLQDRRPLHATPAQIKPYLKSYRRPTVVGLRRALNAYAAGKADRETTTLLKPYGASLARDHFVVLTISRSLFGGDLLRVQFRHHTDSIYLVWVYMLSSGQPAIYGFDRTKCTLAEQRWMASTYRLYYGTRRRWHAHPSSGNSLIGRPHLQRPNGGISIRARGS